ncbi:peptide ABC transporter substrate-binding protein [Alsobacter metallidurans]|uniref:Peptide ABC transporter substrate-binding protein n=1 Tax=Alsobacter metallidurans TaxID=340221 RepID=A0A917I526_9HYPH|nr:ABC transporter substrate-binding protein [Alsobacter metallidurans]GGH11839.1 peptide ABC transporter substrate-binding protein [Alsobacter metallidurans]
MTITRRGVLQTGLAAAAAAAAPGALRAEGFSFQESPMLAERVKKGLLPPVIDRLPTTPLIADFASRKRTVGRYGGEIRTLIAKTRDLRYMSANGYTRVVGYDETLTLQPDLAQSYEEQDNRVFTFTLRRGHRWSNGQPFTSEDFRYYWEDVALNKDLSPSGPPELFMVDGKLPRFEIIDDLRIRYSWDAPNPRFLPALAMPRPLRLFSPSQYLRAFHKRYAEKGVIEKAIAAAKLRNWAALHNRLDDDYEYSNPDAPVLTPWRLVTPPPANRMVFERNPYFHRLDPEGRQLPYVDKVLVDVASPGLFPAKSNAGEVDLQARGLSMNDVPVLKEGEAAQNYRTLLWPYARGSIYTLYPNLNTADPEWRRLNRDIRYRRALSAAIDRRILNNALLFGLGVEGNNTVLATSPLYSDVFRTDNAAYDPELANGLLDEVGLTGRDSSGFRTLPDGRTLEIVVEVDGESTDIVDALQLITEFWRDVGVKLFMKPQDRGILRQRSFSGQTVMVAATGLDNAVPTAMMPPTELAPVRQEHYSWPKWGQWFETQGHNGEEPDTPGGKRLLALYKEWLSATEDTRNAAIWREMLALHAENQWTIGTIAGELQPVVVNKRLRNVPEKALFSWEPTSLMGVYRIDEYYYAAGA